MIPHHKITLGICREVVNQLEKVQETRSLSLYEHNLIKLLKNRILCLLAIQRSRIQRSRLVWLRLGDTNSKYFHIIANNRKKKNRIHSLQSDQGLAFFEENKQRVILKHFKDFLGSYVPRSCTLNLNNLGWAARPLQHLEVPISKEEL